MSLYPLDDLDDADACANCGHEQFVHDDSGCQVCDATDQDCPGFEHEDDASG